MLAVRLAICVGFIVSVANFVVVNGNMRNCADILFERDYVQSNTHFTEILRAFYSIPRNPSAETSDVAEALGKADFYFAVVKDSLAEDSGSSAGYTSNLPPDVISYDSISGLNVEAEFAAVFERLSAETGCEYYRFSSDGTIVKSSGASNKINSSTLSAEALASPFDSIFIGFEKQYLVSRSNEWLRLHEIFLLLFVLCIAATVISLITLVQLILGAGKDAEGELKPPAGFMNWFTEIQLAITGFLFMGAGSALYMLFSEEIIVFNNVDYYTKGITIALAGVVAAVFTLWLTAVIISAAIKLKTRSFWRRTIVGAVLIRLFGWLKRIANGLRGIITGETMKSSGFIRSIVIRLCAFFGFSLVILFFAFIAIGACSEEGIIFLFILECAAFAAFIYGIYTALRDLDRLDVQIDLIHKGELEVKQTISEKSPFYETSAKVLSLGENMQASITERVKAERLKIDLVTNVSHDLKTPLTSIISYISLLEKEEGLSPEAMDYVHILSMKSERLKNIVSDLFELAKTTSGDITVEKERIDLTRLIRQTLGDMEDKITLTGLTVREKLPAEPVMILSDGKRLYRVLQNLFDNALKYSMQGSRIYAELTAEDGRAEIAIKNTSSYEMNFTKEEILERFSRGDRARSTEGSGLGLSIAQGLTIACGGEFDIDIDGDLFKAVMRFPITE